MCFYIVYSSVHLSVGGPVIWVHFRSRAPSTPWNDEMEGGHIPSFHYLEVAPCRWMLCRNYAKTHVSLCDAFPCCTGIMKRMIFSWIIFVLLMSVSGFILNLCDYHSPIWPNNPLHSCVLGCQAFEREWGWSWLCYDTNLAAFQKQTTLLLCWLDTGLHHNKVASSLTPNQRPGN